MSERNIGEWTWCRKCKHSRFMHGKSLFGSPLCDVCRGKKREHAFI